MAHALADYTFDTVRTQLGIRRVLAALGGCPMSCKELMAAIHKSKTGVTHYLRYLQGDEEHGVPRLVRIAEWRENRGRHTPVYALGSGKDARCPPRLTASQRYRKVKADPVKYEKILAAKRERMNSPRPRSAALVHRIERYLAGNANRTMRDIAGALNADHRHVTQNLQRLRKRGKAEITPGHEGKRVPLWRLAGQASPDEVSAPIVVKQWKIPAMPKQNPFSALGI
jgi:hypothetical protein